MHTINNISQRQAVTEADLNSIADELAPGRLPLPYLHPHRTIFLGNWDVNVLELAIERGQGKKLCWHDERDTEFKDITNNVFAVVVNVKCNQGLLRILFPSRHWFGLKLFDGEWWNVDSKLAKPTKIGSIDDVRLFLLDLQETLDAKIFTVR